MDGPLFDLLLEANTIAGRGSTEDMTQVGIAEEDTMILRLLPVSKRSNKKVKVKMSWLRKPEVTESREAGKCVS